MSIVRAKKIWFPLAAVGVLLLLGGVVWAFLGGLPAKPGAVAATRSTAPAAPGGTPVPSTPRTSTPTPSPTPVFIPALTSVPAGTVVAEGQVVSPKGSIRFRYRMVANGDNTYSAEYSNFSSTVPVPVSVTLIDIPPRVGDGLTYHGVGDHTLGGPTGAPTASTALIGVGQPSYLGTLVTYSSVGREVDVPLELGRDKVLAVDTVQWRVPVRESNVRPVDSGAQPGATGTVTATTASGAPGRYLVAEGDTTDGVARRFNIAAEALLWLNAESGTIGSTTNLYASTTLNLNPDDL